MKRKILISALITTLLICVCALSGCSGSTVVDLKNYVGVSFTGYNGSGTANAEVDTDAMLPLFKSGSVTAASLYDSIDASVVEENRKLTNGDTVRVKVTYNEQMMKNAKIELKNTDLTFTVSGLKEKEKLDIFSQVELKVDGASPECKVSVKYPQKLNRTLNELLKIENESGDAIESTSGTTDGAFKLGELKGVFKNGDKLTLTITDKALEGFKEFEIIGETSKEYTVNSESKYILSAADLTDDARKELDKIAEDYLNERIENMDADTRDLIVSAVTGLNIGALKAGCSQRVDDLKVKGFNSAYVGTGEITDWGVKKEVKRAYYFYDADVKYYAKNFFDVYEGEKPLILVVIISDPKTIPNGIEYSSLNFGTAGSIEIANKTWITSKFEKLP